MYHIVIFESTNEVEVVPSNWVNGQVCMWPPTNVMRAIKNGEQPGEGWNAYTIRVIFTAGKCILLDLKTSFLDVRSQTIIMSA